MTESDNQRPLISEEQRARIQFAMTAPLDQLDTTGITLDDPRSFHREFRMALSKYHPPANDGRHTRETELAIVTSDVEGTRRQRHTPIWEGTPEVEHIAAEDFRVNEYVRFLIMERLESTVPRGTTYAL